MGIAYNTSIVPDGLVFALDAANSRSYSGSGTTANGLIGGIGGTLVNGVGFTSTNYGSFVFDGTNDYINVPNGFTLYFKNNDYWSVDLWVKLSTLNSPFPVLVSAGPSIGYYDFFLEVGVNQIYFAAGRGSSGQFLINENVSNTLGYNLTQNYFNIVFIKDSVSTGLVFVNSINIPMSGGTALSGMPNIDEDLRIGTFRQSGFELAGNIGQVKIYNKALTQQEIKQNYNATKKRYL
jgi:hypothetical protein